MSNFTDYGENLVCRILAGEIVDFPDVFYLALCDGADDAGFFELPGVSQYAMRRSLQAWSGTQGAGTAAASSGTSRCIYNNNFLDFGVADEYVVANAIGIYTNENAQWHPLAYVTLPNAMEINAGDSVFIDEGEIELRIGESGGLSHYACNRLLDMIFRGQTHIFPKSYKIGLFTRAPSLAGGGVETQGEGYARATLDAWTAPEGGIMYNDAMIQFASPLESWGTIESAALFDDAGQMIFTAALPAPKTIAAGAGAPFFAERAIKMQVE